MLKYFKVEKNKKYERMSFGVGTSIDVLRDIIRGAYCDLFRCTKNMQGYWLRRVQVASARRANVMKANKSLVIVLLSVFASTQFTMAKEAKDPNSSILTTPPVYDLTGTLGSDQLGKYHSSATNAEGDTYSWWCDTTDTDVDCQEGTGIVHWVNLTDGRRVQYGCETCLTVDLDHSDGAFGFALAPMTDDPWDFLSADGETIHLRIRAVVHLGVVENYVCMPIPHLPSFADGKSREAYAKHHSMEACQLFSGEFTYPPRSAASTDAMRRGSKGTQKLASTRRLQQRRWQTSGTCRRPKRWQIEYELGKRRNAPS